MPYKDKYLDSINQTPLRWDFSPPPYLRSWLFSIVYAFASYYLIDVALDAKLEKLGLIKPTTVHENYLSNELTKIEKNLDATSLTPDEEQKQAEVIVKSNKKLAPAQSAPVPQSK